MYLHFSVYFSFLLTNLTLQKKRRDDRILNKGNISELNLEYVAFFFFASKKKNVFSRTKSKGDNSSFKRFLFFFIYKADNCNTKEQVAASSPHF